MVKMGTVWDRTAEFLSDNIGTIVPLAVLAFFVPASIEGNFSALGADASSGLSIAVGLVRLGFAILSVWGTLAITALAVDSADSRTMGKVAGARLPAALLVALVMLAVLIAAVLPIPLALGLSGADLAALARGEDVPLSTGMSGGIMLYVLVLLALGLWLGARLAVATPVIVREKKMLDALAQSWRLTRGVTWRIIGVMILFGIIAGVSQLAAKLVFGVVFELIAGGRGDGVSLAGVLTSIAAAAVQTAFAVLYCAFSAKLYLALAADAGLREGARAA